MRQIERNHLIPYRALLRRCSLFACESDENLEKLTRGGLCACYSDGELVAEAEVLAIATVVIVEAAAAVLSTTPEGRDVPMTYLQEGEFWGAPLVPPPHGTNEVVAGAAPGCVAWHLSQREILPYLAGRPVRMWEAMLQLGIRLRRTHDQLEGMLTHTTRVRLAHRLAELHAEGGPVIHATHRSLAAQVGTRREEVCRLLAEFRAAGLTGTTGRPSEIAIHDARALATPI